MATKDLQAIVLAAGKSTRFKTEKTKLLEKICGREMVLYVTKLLEQMHIRTTAVVGYQRDAIKRVLKKHHGDTIEFVVQEKQQGTGHAIICAQPTFKCDNILIINGDMPLVTKEIIEELYKKHLDADASVSFVISYNIDPSTGAYGRVIQKDQFIEIVEAKDFKGDIHEHCTINAGIYIVKKSFLQEHINNLQDNNASHEFYVTDLIKIASKHGYPVATVTTSFDRIRGINNFKELWVVEQIKRAEIIKHWMGNGVRFSLAQSVHIDWDVSIGAGTLIDSNVHLLSNTRIGKNCIINGFCSLSNAEIGDNTIVYPHSIINDSSIGKDTKIGPFACIHEQATIGDESVIGNFVEVRKSNVGTQSMAKHLTYLANASIGSNVTIGAGTITCNHDGQQYHETTIENNVIIGSNNSLVAPVTIEEKSTTPAGAIVTNDVSSHQTKTISRCNKKSQNATKKVEATNNKITMPSL